ncbi:MAG TPA: phosphoadenylyl-sulfate reductase [Candidatus Paceibacterota bacterium]|nr:phosphoadenylyl-sulfate reductase [Candidatus Paceibacterota bacterium]
MKAKEWFDGRFSEARMARLGAEFENSSPEDILAWAFQAFGKKVVIAWGGGFEGMALLHMAVGLNPKVRVFVVDTRKLFKETYQLIRVCEERYGIRIDRFFPADKQLRRLAAWHGSRPDLSVREVRTDCCSVRKVMPFLRAIRRERAWITPISRYQPGRENARILSVENERGGIVKICPFVNWTADVFWEYIRRNDVPFNPMHLDGYPSIGCSPEACTRHTLPGENSRGGRFPGSMDKECGIHIHCDVAPQPSPLIRFP